MKPKVLQLIGSFQQGGSELQALQLTRLLSESGRYDIHVACLDSSGPLRSDLGRLRIVPTEYPLTSFYDRNTLTQLRRFASHLRDRRIDVVQTHDFYTNVFGMAAAKLAGVPVRIAARRQTARRGRLQRMAESFAYRFAHAVAANCEAARRDLIAEGVPAERVITIHNGLNFDRLSSRLSRDEALASFNLPSGRRFVTIVANLRLAMKDHPTFLRAAALVHAIHKDAAFVIAGEGELLNSLRALTADLGLTSDVFFIGHCDRVADLLAVSEICTLSSTSEGFSNALLEYMAAARPVVATDVGGAREAVIDGETGYLISPRDHEAMAARISSLLADPSRAREMGARGREVIEQKFSCEAQLERTTNLYAALLDARTATAPRNVQEEFTRG
ncbi:MAG TPA: glycosyltransferase [Blastocatellia bacterium]|nr:glycosyltransferase [Blastocatellia bacterium]